MERLWWVGFSDEMESLLLNWQSYSECESWFLEMISIMLSREQKMWMRKNYMKLAEEEEGR